MTHTTPPTGTGINVFVSIDCVLLQTVNGADYPPSKWSAQRRRHQWRSTVVMKTMIELIRTYQDEIATGSIFFNDVEI
ncbi:MAG: hypothetical protein IPJ39_22785 [Saprospiraceae bacterium]|nr:hypothetical protein [Saprospiraceae bacterium]